MNCNANSEDISDSVLDDLKYGKKVSFIINIAKTQNILTSFKTSRAVEATVWGPLFFIDAESPWQRKSTKRNCPKKYEKQIRLT